ncbi:MAG: glycosyltransferase family 87 protein [Candidatus Saelkia tenebricola]|nr:glycosyltransferase family 87 protein [Candidatus Saelkia tenebricola]
MKKRIFICLLLLLVLVSTARYIRRAPKRDYSDFHVVYSTAQRFIQGEEIYTFEGDVSYYKYPPFYAFLTSFLAFSSEFKAAVLWHFLNWIFLFLIFFSWLNILDSKKRILISMLVFIFSFRFILENMDQGQANISFLAFSSIAFYFYFKGKRNISALFLAVSILSKYLSIVFIPFFIIRKEYKYALRTLVFLVILYFSPVILTGVERMYHLMMQNIQFLFSSSLDNYSITCYPNQSLLAALRRMFSLNQWYPTQVYALSDKTISFIFFMASFILLFLAYIPRRDIRINIGLISGLIPLLNPNGWKNSFIWLIVPSMILFQQIFEKRVKNKFLITMVILSFVFTSCTSEFFVYWWAKDWFEIYSFVTYGALFLYFALLKFNLSNKIISEK